MYTNKQLTQTGRSRRTYSPEFKAQLVAACRIPGMSVASVARNHGINHNILHRWLRELSDSGQPHIHSTVDLRPPGFIELPIPQALPEPSPPTTPPITEGCVHLELQRGELSLKLSWPASSATECAVWLRELLR
jgi:transposase-like protein